MDKKSAIGKSPLLRICQIIRWLLLLGIFGGLFLAVFDFDRGQVNKEKKEEKAFAASVAEQLDLCEEAIPYGFDHVS